MTALYIAFALYTFHAPRFNYVCVAGKFICETPTKGIKIKEDWAFVVICRSFQLGALGKQNFDD